MANKWLKHVRLSIGFANIVFLFVGAVLLGLGAWIFVDALNYFDAIEKGSPYGPSLLSIVVGTAFVVVSLCGCIGAFAKSRIMVMIYIALLLLILIFQVVMITLAFDFKEKAEENVRKGLTIALDGYNTDGDDKTSSLDNIQKDFQCCGIDSYSDWSTTPWHLVNNPTKLYPLSCCKDQTLNGCDSDATHSFSKGCFVAYKNWTRDKMIILSSVSIALLVIQIFGILIGVILLRMTPKTEVKQVS